MRRPNPNAVDGALPPTDADELLDAFFDNSHDFLGIIEVFDETLDLRYVKVNRAAGDYVGLAPESMVGAYASEIGVSEAVRRLWCERCLEAKRACMPVGFNYSRELPDGLHALEATVLHLTRSHFCFAISDVTPRKRAEDALRESEERFRAIFDSTTSCMVVIVDRVIRFLNKATLQTFGYAEEELIGQSTALIHASAQTFERYGREAYESLESRGQWEGEIPCRTKHGDRLWMDTRLSVLPGVGIVAVLNDTTDRRRAEKQRRDLEARLQRAERMEALGTLAGHVAHDLNNVLSGLVSIPDLLLLNLPKDSPLLPDIQRIFDSGKRAAAIVGDLLTLARKTAVASEVADLNELVTAYLTSLEHQALMNRLPGRHVAVELQAKLDNVLCSATHIGKAIANLVTNAIEATREGGHVWVASAARRLETPIDGFERIPPGDYVVLTVRDDGAGIAASEIVRIFEPFHSTKSPGHSGTGLGMAVVWATVKDHHGYIDIRSEPGVGTTIELYLPTTQEARNEREPLQVDLFLGHGERLLVVDDLKEQRTIISSLLRKLRYNVDAVASGEEAVEYVARTPVDLVILDMILGEGMDGLDTSRKLLEVDPGLKVIVSSGYADAGRIDEALQLGVLGSLRKPYTIEEIGLAVWRALQSEG